MNIQDWFPLGWIGWISLQSKGLSKSLLQHHSSKASILWCSAFFIVQLSYPPMTTGKTMALTRWTFVGKVILCFFSFSFFFFYFILLYNTVLVLPYIAMNPSRVYMRSQTWTHLPSPSPQHLSGSSPCTSPKHAVSCIRHRLAIHFTW